MRTADGVEVEEGDEVWLPLHDPVRSALALVMVEGLDHTRHLVAARFPAAYCYSTRLAALRAALDRAHREVDRVRWLIDAEMGPPAPVRLPLLVRECDFKASLRLALGTSPALRLWEQPVAVAYLPVGEDGKAMLDALVRQGRARRASLGRPGMADLSGVCLGSGRRIELEVKALAGRVSPEQAAWGEFIRGAGGVYVLARPAKGETLREATERTAGEVLEAVR